MSPLGKGGRGGRGEGGGGDLTDLLPLPRPLDEQELELGCQVALARREGVGARDHALHGLDFGIKGRISVPLVPLCRKKSDNFGAEYFFTQTPKIHPPPLVLPKSLHALP